MLDSCRYILRVKQCNKHLTHGETASHAARASLRCFTPQRDDKGRGFTFFRLPLTYHLLNR